VQGEWGVGKSRLVAAVVARAAERGGHVLLGRAYESEQILPFSPWVDALRAGRVIPHMVQELNDPWRMELARLFPELGRGDTEPPAGEDYVRLFEAMTRVVQYLASGQPLLVVLEDLHWADDMSLRLLVFLSRRIPDWPVLVIGTFRVEELADALVLRRSVAQLAQQSRSLSLSLAALSERESMALVRALMRAGREESVVTRIAQTVWRVSAGNPFMVVEAVRMLEGRDPATGPEDVVIPQAVRAVIAGRLERLTDRGRRLAGVASVIGREFDFTVLSDAAELSAAETAEGVEDLVGRRILQAVGEALDFTHDRIRDVAYELVLPAHRRLLAPRRGRRAGIPGGRGRGCPGPGARSPLCRGGGLESSVAVPGSGGRPSSPPLRSPRGDCVLRAGHQRAGAVAAGPGADRACDRSSPGAPTLLRTGPGPRPNP
jgi:predicted ATPase